MRKKITAANWKMNMTKKEVDDFMTDLHKNNLDLDTYHKVVIAAPYIYLESMRSSVQDLGGVEVYAENVHYADSGAYTGEISCKMLKSIGINGVIIGHSERRELFDESLEIIEKKLRQAVKHEMDVILCCGEPLHAREAGGQEEYIRKQLESAFEKMTATHMEKITIAYEPIWAIGTGKTATPRQAQDTHSFIRTYLKNKFNDKVAQETSILYGGSVKPQNAGELLNMPDIDGGLIGGASLNSQSFLELILLHKEIK